MVVVGAAVVVVVVVVGPAVVVGGGQVVVVGSGVVGAPVVLVHCVQCTCPTQFGIDSSGSRQGQASLHGSSIKIQASQSPLYNHLHQEHTGGKLLSAHGLQVVVVVGALLVVTT